MKAAALNTHILACYGHTHLDTLSTNMKPLKSVRTLLPTVELSPLLPPLRSAAPALVLSR